MRKANFAYLLIGLVVLSLVTPAVAALDGYLGFIVAALVSSHIAARQREEGEG